ncbi:GNAT family N-acetyltransferase [Methanobrevibacter sp.]|uniref:GNAT family N-acetyltransferase n=1 Tax=Methanobrevibacter sp. TaxID=66852 RepID=UPI00389034A0
MSDAKFRFAEKKDTGTILEFIRDLAIYEKMLDEVVATEELLNEWLFEKNIAEVIFVLEDDVEVGFALFFYNFSTFLGKAGIYLEDLFVKPEYRGKGYGKALIEKLAEITVERDCGRLEWCCLDWNQPSIDFYLSLGAKPLDDWTTFRLTGNTLIDLSKK